MAKKSQKTTQTPNAETVGTFTSDAGKDGFTETGDVNTQASDVALKDQVFVIVSPLLLKGKILKPGAEVKLNLDDAEITSLLDKKIIKAVEV